MTGERARAIAGTILFLCVAPGTFCVFVPWWISRWQMQPPFFGFDPIRWLGVLVLAVGALLVIETFARFALQGLGTPAPIAPTRTLVVTGSYRYVRNPMYVGVLSVVFGQGLLFGNGWVLLYGLAAWAAVHGFVLAYEEPTLARTYGDQYARYRANVRRWLPRLRPWSGRPA
jgi:protein-S-isoprenylcysteine O-methyltransferase Ste14